MIMVYGIKTCDSVRKALKFFKENNIDVEFIDIRKKMPVDSLIKSWCEKTDINIVFNSRGTTYRTLKLKELNLDKDGKFDWLCKEPMLIKRPVVDYDGEVLVGFDEPNYSKMFL